MRIPQVHLAAIAVVGLLIGASLLFVALRDPAPAPELAPGPKRIQPAGQGELQWPPVLDQPYPALVLLGLDDQYHAIAELKGRPVLIQVVGMSCPASNAWAGAGEKDVGGFQGVAPQADLPSLRASLLSHAGGLALDDRRFTVVHLLLYDLTLHAPSLADARAWAAHFGVDKLANHLVLIGDEQLVCPASYAMVPGFQLLDRELILRRDATGHQPRNNLYTELLPELARMLVGTAAPPSEEPPDSGISLTVDAAYKALGQTREPLDFAGQAVPADERQALERLLRALDEGVRLRIALWQACSTGNENSLQLLSRLQALRFWVAGAAVPATLIPYRDALAAALAAQVAFYGDWASAGKAFDVARFAAHPQAHACSAAVHKAYTLLKRLYPEASAHDQEVLEHRHCALDLI